MKYVFFALVILKITVCAAQAEDWQFDFILENDAILFPEDLNFDRHYTNGIQVKLKTPSLYDFSMGQLIFTPDDTKVSILQENDRPYAGYLFVSAARNTIKNNRMLHMRLTAGIIGRAALGEQMQNGYHSITSNNNANGWDNQLGNEPALMVSFSSIWAMNENVMDDDFSWNLLPYAGTNIGSPYTLAIVGGELRLGYKMSEDYTISGINFISGVAVSQNENQNFFSGYFFMGMEGLAVLWNTFLDGNVFRSSHSVDKKNFVANAKAGIVIKIKRARITYAQVYQSREFHGQKSNHLYGSIQIGYLF